jgi:hypothetical protein
MLFQVYRVFSILRLSEPSNNLPFLDMKLYWDKHDELAFTVYRKLGQQLKYLNNDSTHPPHVFRAISVSIYARLAKLTSYDSTNRHKTIRELHPDHCNALDHAKLSSKEEKITYTPLHEAMY